MLLCILIVQVEYNDAHQLGHGEWTQVNSDNAMTAKGARFRRTLTHLSPSARHVTVILHILVTSTSIL